MSASPSWKPTKNFYKAVRIAGKGHENETRKGSNIPYLGHLLGVASMVIEAGGSEDQAMGALLHDRGAFAVILADNDQRPAVDARRREVRQRIRRDVDPDRALQDVQESGGRT